MNKILALALLTGGVALIICGVNASNSIGSHFSRLFTGSPTDKSVCLLIGGIVLIIYGVAANDSAASGFSRFFTGSPTDKTMWLLIGGVVAAAIGAGGMIRGSKSS